MMTLRSDPILPRTCSSPTFATVDMTTVPRMIENRGTVLARCRDGARSCWHRGMRGKGRGSSSEVKAAGIVVPRVVDPIGNRHELKWLLGGGGEHGFGIGVLRVEPFVELIGGEDERHAVVDGPHGGAGVGRDDGEGIEVVPGAPEP